MKIIINESQIKYQTDKAYLISVPNSKGRFWISEKMVWPARGDKYSVLLPDSWSYQIIKGKRGQNKELVDIEYMKEHFSNQLAFETIHHKPSELKADYEIDKSLIK